MQSPRYNNPFDIAAHYLNDLEGLNRLAADRRQAKKDGIPLSVFYVLGRWIFDQFAQVCPLGDRHNKAPAELGTCPPVMTPEQVQLFMRDDTLAQVFDWPFPPEYVSCSACGEKWTIHNARDFMHHETSEEVPIESFVGSPLSDITEIPEFHQLKKHFVTHDMIYSDHPPEEVETREAMNGNRWRYVDKDYVVQSGDRASVRVMSFTHKACYQRVAERRTRVKFEEAFSKAGYPRVNLITRKNEYCPCESCTPWYSAQVAGSLPFKLGWRKSVINLSWEETGMELPDLFEGEDVTRDRYYIHAHGYEKLAQYLTKLLPALGAAHDP